MNNASETNLKVYTIAELSQILKIGRNTAYRLVKSNKIRCIHCGKTIRIPYDAVIEYLKSAQ